MSDIQVLKDKDGVEERCISTVGINRHLPCVIKGEDIEKWGFKLHTRVRAGMWWKYSDVPAILKTVIDKIEFAKEHSF